jgi:hypothetical protein
MARGLSRRHSLAVVLVCAGLLGCRNTRDVRRPREPPPPGLQPTVLDYAESEAFDTIFETVLANQDPVIVVRTGTTKPDWGPRLNAWIAAWNWGGKVADAEAPAATYRGQSPVTVNGETLREFRLLIDDLLTRVEGVARRGSTWWVEERTRKRRIALLKPYSLRFHLDDERQIQLIFFHGTYAPYYGPFVQSIAEADGEEARGWKRDVTCSRCKERRAAEDDAGAAPGAQVGWGMP